MEVYVDDMLLKSFKKIDHIKDLEEAFGILRRYQMKLNSSKYTFDITASKFLEFLSQSEASKQTQRKSKPFLICSIWLLRKKCNNWLNTLWHLVCLKLSWALPAFLKVLH